jgi:hypothetical protein
MNKYLIRVNCPAFQDIEIEAENEKDAICEATNKFNCNGAIGEYCETLEVT